MPCMKCQDGKGKYGEKGDCVHDSKEACDKARKAIHSKERSMRGEQIKGYLANGMFAVCPQFLEGIVSAVNSEDIKSETVNDVSPAHSYEKRGSIAVISVDGAMTKKNSWMNAMCGGFASYDILGHYVDKAENDPEIKTIVFNVDTPGGEVAGADDLGEKIHASTKDTITYYNNLGASAGIWVFSAAKKRFANETAQLGSIGVMAGFREPSGESDRVTMVSKNAKNKNCALNGDCASKIQDRIDHIETIFFSRVTRNTGLTAEQITEGFKEGSVITAKEAEALGFIEGVTTLDKLLNSAATMPSAKEKIVALNPIHKGVSMEFNKDNFDALLAASVTHADEINALKAQLNEQTEAAAKLTAELNATRSDADAFKVEAATRIREAIHEGVSAEIAVQMLEAPSSDAASLLALRSKQTNGATVQPSANSETPEQDEDAAILAYAQTMKGRLR